MNIHPTNDKNNMLFVGIASLDDLADQNEIEYGTVANSAPYHVFSSSHNNPYKKMSLVMENPLGKRYPSIVNTTEYGIELVRQSYGTTQRKTQSLSFLLPLRHSMYFTPKLPYTFSFRWNHHRTTTE